MDTKGDDVMSAPKAKHTDMATKRWKKAKAQVEELQAEAGQLRMSVLNIRQMYEGSIGEKNALQAQLANANQLLVAAVVAGRGKKITIKKSVFEQLSDYAGVDTKEVDGDLVISALTVADIEAMQAEIDEA
jgi:uncharacterized protein YlxW (UPF0749 family)